jgi:hypothetical protein
MTEPTSVASPELVTLRRVELVKAGHWELSTGPWDATPQDLYQAVAATDCPAVRQPVLKLGHTDVRAEGNATGDGEPALGWVGDMAVVDGGSTLVGDYKGMPRWFADILASAYPSRSIEGYYDYVCGLGHTHPFVIDAVALLGVTHPGVAAIESLNARSIAELYGVMASTEPDVTRSFVATVKGSDPVTDTKVAAAATSQDVISAFYDLPAVSLNWWMWCEELYIDPMQIIACDDSDGTLWLYTYAIDADGNVTFGTPEQVKRTYVAAAQGKVGAKFASMAESRPQAAAQLAARKAFAAEDGGDQPTETNKEDGTVDVLSELRTRLGVAADADESTTLAALDEALAEQAVETAPVTAAAPAPGTVTVDAAQWEALQAAAKAGQEARAEQVTARREALVTAALADGRIAPKNADGWRKHLAAGSDEMRAAAETQLAELAPNTFPVKPLGHAQGSSDALAASNGEGAFVPGESRGWVVPTK